MRTLIIGNSGSGKTTLGRRLAHLEHARFMSLDELAFVEGVTRQPLHKSVGDGLTFLRAHPRVVLEGCYADIGHGLVAELERLVLLNPGTQTCVAHCRARPWEPDKFASEAAQNALLNNLIEWVATYDEREDEYGLRAHRALFDVFAGAKVELNVPSTYAADLTRAFANVS